MKFSAVNEIEVEDDEVIDYIKNHFRPEDIFEDADLEDWANNNGFIKEE
jgi:hypothetical protein